MFANDGVKLPSNTSKAKSGTRKDFQREADKIERAVRKMLAEHQGQDAPKAPIEGAENDRAKRKMERMMRLTQSIRQ